MSATHWYRQRVTVHDDYRGTSLEVSETLLGVVEVRARSDRAELGEVKLQLSLEDARSVLELLERIVTKRASMASLAMLLVLALGCTSTSVTTGVAPIATGGASGAAGATAQGGGEQGGTGGASGGKGGSAGDVGPGGGGGALGGSGSAAAAGAAGAGGAVAAPGCALGVALATVDWGAPLPFELEPLQGPSRCLACVRSPCGDCNVDFVGIDETSWGGHVKCGIPGDYYLRAGATCSGPWDANANVWAGSSSVLLHGEPDGDGWRVVVDDDSGVQAFPGLETTEVEKWATPAIAAMMRSAVRSYLERRIPCP